MEITPVYFSAAAAAKRLGVDRSTIARWVTDGRLRPAVQVEGWTGRRSFGFTEAELARCERSAVPA